MISSRIVLLLAVVTGVTGIVLTGAVHLRGEGLCFTWWWWREGDATTRLNAPLGGVATRLKGPLGGVNLPTGLAVPRGVCKVSAEAGKEWWLTVRVEVTGRDDEAVEIGVSDRERSVGVVVSEEVLSPSEDIESC